jgi:hypothetical protein
MAVWNAEDQRSANLKKIVAEMADIRKSLEFTAVMRGFYVRPLAELSVDLADKGWEDSLRQVQAREVGSQTSGVRRQGSDVRD